VALVHLSGGVPEVAIASGGVPEVAIESLDMAAGASGGLGV